MHTHVKAEVLNIRASAPQKALLAEAARLRNMNVSQFVLSRSLDAAGEILAEQALVRLAENDYNRFISRLEEPPRDLPKLRELFSKPSVLEG